MPKFLVEFKYTVENTIMFHVYADNQQDAKKKIQENMFAESGPSVLEIAEPAINYPQMEALGFEYEYSEYELGQAHVEDVLDAYDCDTCEDAKSIDCNVCHATGEGMTDGSRCTACSGRGYNPCKNCCDDPDEQLE